MMAAVDYRMHIFTAAGGVRRIKDTISILKDVRTQGYLIVNAIRTEQEGAGDVI